MLWTQDRIKLSRLLAEGYEFDAITMPYDYGKHRKGEHIVYVIGDPQAMRWNAQHNFPDNTLLENIDELAFYYEKLAEWIIKEDLEQGKDPDAFGDDTVYTPDTNIDSVLERTWDYGVIGACYLPDAINAVWLKTNYERTQ